MKTIPKSIPKEIRLKALRIAFIKYVGKKKVHGFLCLDLDAALAEVDPTWVENRSEFDLNDSLLKLFPEVWKHKPEGCTEFAWWDDSYRSPYAKTLRVGVLTVAIKELEDEGR